MTDDAYIQRTEKCIDDFARKNNPCCAGCLHWQYANAASGDCLISPILSPKDRFSLVFDQTSAKVEHGYKAGQLITPRHHVCGNFEDDGID